MNSNHDLQQILIHDTTNSEMSKQDITTDVKFQNITYHMDNIDKTIHPQDHVQIDFLKAMNEMKNLDWKYKNNYIAFENEKTKDYVQFLRKDEDWWYADIPINMGKNWDGYAWGCYSKLEPITNMLRLFFEEVPWFGMLSWKMRRFKH